MTYEGTLGVHRTTCGKATVFDVFFAPNAIGDACNSRRFREIGELGDFLESLELNGEIVVKALEEVCKGRSAAISHVKLSDEVIQVEGLDSSATLNRRMN
jgi:hypothetical protein